MRNLVQRYLYYLCCGQYRVGRLAIKRLALKEKKTINTEVESAFTMAYSGGKHGTASVFDETLG